MIAMTLTVTIKRRKHYSMKTKREVLASIAALHLSERAASARFGVPRRTLAGWLGLKESILGFQGSEKALARTPGRKPIIPFPGELLTFMKDVRRANRALTTAKMAGYIRSQHPQWLDGYMQDKKSIDKAYASLMRLLCRFAANHGFSRRTPSGLKVRQIFLAFDIMRTQVMLCRNPK